MTRRSTRSIVHDLLAIAADADRVLAPGEEALT